MTPDELRRMDNDLCIIFEKGLKPVKTKKFYYFEKPMVKQLQQYRISHNEFQGIERGTWRKFNPYKPYVEGDEKQENKDLNIESLDDLFDDDSDKKDNKERINNIKEEPATLSRKEREEIELTKEELDLQKQLEAKFDELFGPLDDDNE